MRLSKLKTLNIPEKKKKQNQMDHVLFTSVRLWARTAKSGSVCDFQLLQICLFIVPHDVA